MFLRMSYRESQQSATPQPHMTQLTASTGGEPETRRRDWWADRSASQLEPITLSWGLSISWQKRWGWVSERSCRWNGDQSVEVCFNNDQTTGFSKHHLNSPPLNYSDSGAERLYCVSLFKQTVGIIVCQAGALVSWERGDPPGTSVHMKAERTIRLKCWPKIQFSSPSLTSFTLCSWCVLLVL